MYREHYYQISRIGAFSIVHIQRKTPSRSDPKVSLSETISSYKVPSSNKRAVTTGIHHTIDRIIEGKAGELSPREPVYPMDD